MKRAALVMTALVLFGSAMTAAAQTTVIVPAPAPAVVSTPAPVAVAPAPGTFSGEAWTWDSARNIVTLFDAGRQFRVLVTPDQIARLNHHAWVTVKGTLVGPDSIDTVIVPTQPLVAQPAGASTTAQIAGSVAAIDTNGVATVETSRGPLRVWLADGGAARFATGRPVMVQVTVQPVRMVAVAGGGGLASGPTLVAPVPGDAATVTGRVLAISPTGSLTVESPRGPINVWVSNAASFKVGDFVQVQTVVQPA
jgi:hypothetical protein